MNETPINPYVGFALDAYPYTCEKYGTTKVAGLVELCFHADVSPIECMAIIEIYLPLTKEENIKQEEMIEKNMNAMFMLQPELKQEFEEFQKRLGKIVE
jgi:aldehyde:ferredoxin oxidoreductase